MYSETCDERPPNGTIERGLSLQVQMYRNVGPCYCNSGLSMEVSLSSQWSHLPSFTIHVSGFPTSIITRNSIIFQVIQVKSIKFQVNLALNDSVCVDNVDMTKMYN